MSLRDWAEIGAEAGLDGIDLSIIFLKNHTPVYLRQVEKDFQAVGLPVVMITTYPDFCHPDAVQRERELAYLRHDIAMASDLRTPYLRIVAGQAHPDIKEHDAFDWVLDGFKRAADFAQAFDVQLVYENHSKPGAWAYTDFSHSTERFLKIAAALRDTAIGINFDTGNTLVYGDDPAPVLEAVIDQVMTVHAADTSTRGKLDPVALGTGQVPFPELFAILKRSGFDGWISIEEASGTGVGAVKKAADFVRQTWSASVKDPIS